MTETENSDSPQVLTPSVESDRSNGIVYLVDDDTAVLQSLGRLLRVSGFEVELFTSPREFLSRRRSAVPSCVIVDLKMPEMSGLDVQRALADAGSHLPVIFLTGYGDIPTTVDAMKAGASDFLTKPVEGNVLVERVREAIQQSKTNLRELAVKAESARVFNRLTSREREVCILVGQGYSNKEISAELGAAEKTVKNHRARVMFKLGAASVPDLVRLLDSIGRGGSYS